MCKTVVDDLAGGGVKQPSQERLSGICGMRSFKSIQYGNISAYNTWASY